MKVCISAQLPESFCTPALTLQLAGKPTYLPGLFQPHYSPHEHSSYLQEFPSPQLQTQPFRHLQLQGFQSH